MAVKNAFPRFFILPGNCEGSDLAICVSSMWQLYSRLDIPQVQLGSI